MTEPGEIIVIKAVAAGVKYDPAGSPVRMRAGGIALLRKSKYLNFSKASGLHLGEGTHSCGSNSAFCCRCIITVQTGHTQTIQKGGDQNFPSTVLVCRDSSEQTGRPKTATVCGVMAGGHFPLVQGLLVILFLPPALIKQHPGGLGPSTHISDSLVLFPASC